MVSCGVDHTGFSTPLRHFNRRQFHARKRPALPCGALVRLLRAECPGAFLIGDVRLENFLGHVSRRFRAWNSIPYAAFIFGFTKRQPMVVSSTCCLREKALVALALTQRGRSDMLSKPPGHDQIASRFANLARRGRGQGFEARTAEKAGSRFAPG